MLHKHPTVRLAAWTAEVPHALVLPTVQSVSCCPADAHNKVEFNAFHVEVGFTGSRGL
jgi:hypothetical protein